MEFTVLRGDHMHASLYLRAAARVELQAEGLYLALAQAFDHLPLARDTFIRLAYEERQHALRFQLLERLGIPLPWSDDKMDFMRENLERQSIEIVDIKALVLGPGGPRDPYVVLRRIADMVDRFSFLHPEQVAADADPRLREVISSMSRQDAEHSRLIRMVNASRPARRDRASGA